MWALPAWSLMNANAVPELSRMSKAIYYAIALDYLEPGSGADPELLERIRTRATAFTLNDGQVMTLDLKLVNNQ